MAELPAVCPSDGRGAWIRSFGKNLVEQRVVVTLTHRKVQTKVREHYRSVKFTVFFDVAPCSRVEVDRLFRGSYCLHHQDDDYHNHHHPD
jgi:hypothetical protein